MGSPDSKETPGKGAKQCVWNRGIFQLDIWNGFFPWGTCGSGWISSASVDAQYYLWQIREIIVSEQ